MSASGVDLDRVAKALGVSTDAGIVDELFSSASRLHLLSELVLSSAERLDGVVPDASAGLRQAASRIDDAYDAIGVLVTAAEDHVRGGGR
jgi:hypothetical protein